MSVSTHLKGVCSLVFVVLNLGAAVVPALLFGLAKRLVPRTAPRIDPLLESLYRAAVRRDDWWFKTVLGVCWEDPGLPLRRDGRYLVIANHRTWADTFIVQSVLVRRGPIVKFLVKDQLRWVPIIGQVIWAYAFPVVKRGPQGSTPSANRRRNDLGAVAQACQSVRDAPAALLNFVEGTRLTPAKHAASHSPYRHLLPPRVGGLGTMIDTLRDDIDGCIDITLLYPPAVSFWRFLCGRPVCVEVEARMIERSELPPSGDARAWLETLWRGKDARLDAWFRQSAEGEL